MNLLIPFEERNEELLERVKERFTSFGKVSITDIVRRGRAHSIYGVYIYVIYCICSCSVVLAVEILLSLLL